MRFGPDEVSVLRCRRSTSTSGCGQTTDISNICWLSTSAPRLKIPASVPFGTTIAILSFYWIILGSIHGARKYWGLRIWHQQAYLRENCRSHIYSTYISFCATVSDSFAERILSRASMSRAASSANFLLVPRVEQLENYYLNTWKTFIWLPQNLSSFGYYKSGAEFVSRKRPNQTKTDLGSSVSEIFYSRIDFSNSERYFPLFPYSSCWTKTCIHISNIYNGSSNQFLRSGYCRLAQIEEHFLTSRVY